MDQYPTITTRQMQILKAIIDEYINTADAVGSDTLEKKYNLGVSPATIRNEMVRLTDSKYLKQPHTSAGRVPTPLALKFYVEHLMKLKNLSLTDEVAVKEKMWDYRSEMDKLLREATRALAGRTKTLAIATTDEGDIYFAGAAYMLDMPEFYDYELTHAIFATLDEFDFWIQLVTSRPDSLAILLGEEFGGRRPLSQCGFVYKRFDTVHSKGAIGVIGPSRLNYPYIIPIVSYVGGLIDEFGKRK